MMLRGGACSTSVGRVAVDWPSFLPPPPYFLLPPHPTLPPWAFSLICPEKVAQERDILDKIWPHRVLGLTNLLLLFMQLFRRCLTFKLHHWLPSHNKFVASKCRVSYHTFVCLRNICWFHSKCINAKRHDKWPPTVLVWTDCISEGRVSKHCSKLKAYSWHRFIVLLIVAPGTDWTISHTVDKYHVVSVESVEVVAERAQSAHSIKPSETDWCVSPS